MFSRSGAVSAFLILPLLSVSLLAGCGGSDRLSGDDYRAELKTLGKRETAAHREVEKAFKAKTVDEIKTRLAAFADNEQRLGDDLAKLKAPEDAERANADISAGARELATEIRDVVGNLSASQTPKAALEEVNKKLENASGAKKLDAGLSKLKKLGYTTSG